jgi:hypothetical protein
MCAGTVESSAPIVCPLPDEPWGLRRFFVSDPNGAIINITQHLEDES